MQFEVLDHLLDAAESGCDVAGLEVVLQLEEFELEGHVWIADVGSFELVERAFGGEGV